MAVLAEKYATDYKWYVDVILNLIRLAGDYVSEEVWYRVIQIVINRKDFYTKAIKVNCGCRLYVDIMTEENKLANMELIYLSVRSSCRK